MRDRLMVGQQTLTLFIQVRILVPQPVYTIHKVADVTHNTIIKIESGANKNPTIEILSKIAKALDVGVASLFRS